MSSKELIAQIEKRFEIVLTISIFFPVLMATYFDIVGGPDKNNHSAFTFFALPAFYISSYVVFQLYKKSSFIPKWAFEILDWSLLGGIVCFAMPIIFAVMSYSGSGTVISRWSYWIDMWTFQGSMWGLAYFSIGISLYVAANSVIAVLAEIMGKKWRNKKIF